MTHTKDLWSKTSFIPNFICFTFILKFVCFSNPIPLYLHPYIYTHVFIDF